MSKNYNSNIPQDWDMDALYDEDTKRKMQIEDLSKQYTERTPFSYDPELDAGYQSYVQMMKANGQTAMEDTMGKAASLTGGYGNSYAASVGQQVYNDYMKQAAAAQGEYYDRALAKYNAEGNDLLSRLGILQDQEATAYERAWNENERNYQRDQDAQDRAWNEAQIKAQYEDPSGLFDLGVSKEAYNKKFEQEQLEEYQQKPLTEKELTFNPTGTNFALINYFGGPKESWPSEDVFFDYRTGEGYTLAEVHDGLVNSGMNDAEIYQYLVSLMGIEIGENDDFIRAYFGDF